MKQLIGLSQVRQALSWSLVLGFAATVFSAPIHAGVGVVGEGSEDVEIVTWQGSRTWSCEKAADAKINPTGFLIEKPAIKAYTCADSSGICLSINTSVTFYRCVAQKDGSARVESYPANKFSRDYLAIRGPRGGDITGLSRWKYIDLADNTVVRANARTNKSNLNLDMGLDEALELGNKDKDGPFQNVEISVNWHWDAICAAGSSIFPCPSKETPRARQFYRSYGYFELTFLVDVNKLSPSVEILSFKKGAPHLF